jgi:hypothetical protein
VVIVMGRVEHRVSGWKWAAVDADGREAVEVF